MTARAARDPCTSWTTSVRPHGPSGRSSRSSVRLALRDPGGRWRGGLRRVGAAAGLGPVGLATGFVLAAGATALGAAQLGR